MDRTLATWSGAAPARWDELVCRLGGSIFHSTAWALYQKATTRAHPIFALTMDDNGHERAGALLLLHKSDNPIASLLSRTLQICAHPFAQENNAALVAEFMRRCESWARRQGCR